MVAPEIIYVDGDYTIEEMSGIYHVMRDGSMRFRALDFDRCYVFIHEDRHFREPKIVEPKVPDGYGVW